MLTFLVLKQNLAAKVVKNFRSGCFSGEKKAYLCIFPAFLAMKSFQLP